jgi:hypothetical protein
VDYTLSGAGFFEQPVSKPRLDSPAPTTRASPSPHPSFKRTGAFHIFLASLLRLDILRMILITCEGDPLLQQNLDL